MRDELQTAHDMQMGLLPERVELDGYSVDGLLVPANNVGRDYFAYRWIDDAREKFAIVIADVSGKAMEAAVTALRFNEMLRYEIRNRTTPADIINGLNDSLEGQIDPATFITCCIAVVDLPTGTVEIVNAGHCPPIHGGPKRDSALVDLTGLPLGIPKIIRPDFDYASRTISLDPGEGLVLYSDGIVEARNTDDEMFEEERFLSLLEREAIWGRGARAAVKTLHDEVETFIGRADRSDDLTLVVLLRDS